MEKLFVVNGRIMPSDEFTYLDTYYSLTFDFKNEVGAIKRASGEFWVLTTTIEGAEEMHKSKTSLGDKEAYYQHYRTFELCLERLKKICKWSVEVINDDDQRNLILYYKIDEPGELGFVPKSKIPVLEQLLVDNYRITPGAEFKLELYLESLKKGKVQFVDSVLNATIYKHIMQLHTARMINEKSIIRPEDIPDFDNE